MASYQNMIERLVGSVSTAAHLDDWCMEGAKTVINSMPQQILEKIQQESAFTVSQSISGRKVIDILRNDGTIYQPCRKIPAMMSGRVTDSKDMNYALGSDPVYYFHDEKCFVKPTPGTDEGIMMYVGYPTIDASDDDFGDISYFPDEYEYLIVLYAGLKALQQKLNAKTASLPSDISISGAPSTPNITTVAYTDASEYDASGGDASNVDSVRIDAVTSAVITKPAKIDVSSHAPDFIAPTVAGATEELTSTMTSGSIGTAADMRDFSKWFDVLGDMLETEEDIELAQAQMQKITTYVQTYAQALQVRSAEFQQENTRYQTEFQEEVTKVNGDLQALMAEFQSEAAIAQFNSQQAQSLSQANKAADQSLDQFNKQQTQALDQFNKQQKTQVKMANRAKQMERIMADNSSIMQKYGAEIQDYSGVIGARVQEFNTTLQKASTDYQWLHGQYGLLKAEYTEGIQLMMQRSN
jgi:hypothetical protein